MHKRIIIKIGTRALSHNDGSLNEAVIEHLVEQIITLRKRGNEVVLVTSGAVGAGRSFSTTHNKKETIADKQVFAAIGQVALLGIYSRFLAQHDTLCAQVLVTKEDFRDRTHYMNMRTCFQNLLRDNILPIVNENDVIALRELVFTDNDELAGLVAMQLDADAVIFLTSVAGVLRTSYDGQGGEVVPQVTLAELASLEKHILPEKTAFGRGGMLTKFAVTKKLLAAGITVYMADGGRKNALTDLLANKTVGTVFVPHRKTSALKRRLAYSDGLTKGSVVVNQCASDLLRSKEKIVSLLPVGITAVKGDFKKGDIIEVYGPTGNKIGFGMSRYDATAIHTLIGTHGGRAVIHYDYLFIY